MSRRPFPTAAFAGAALLGLAGGWLLSRWHDSAHQADLFSAQAWQRFAALGWLASEGNVDDIPVLLDYLQWEPLPALRKRAASVLATLEGAA